jgi:hypothetical protein
MLASSTLGATMNHESGGRHPGGLGIVAERRGLGAGEFEGHAFRPFRLSGFAGQRSPVLLAAHALSISTI